MKHINRVAKLGDIDYSPLAQNVNTDLLNPRADCRHGFPINWFESVLNRTEFEACGTAGLIGKIPKIIEARPYKVQWLHSY